MYNTWSTCKFDSHAHEFDNSESGLVTGYAGGQCDSEILLGGRYEFISYLWQWRSAGKYHWIVGWSYGTYSWHYLLSESLCLNKL